MERCAGFVLPIILTTGLFTFVFGQQSDTTPMSPTANDKIIVVATKATSDSIVAVPPATSVQFGLQADKSASSGSIELSNWIEKEYESNGLHATNLLPWHIVVSYDQYDEDGDNVHSGVYEEYWAGPTKYKRIYKADDLNQTDFATDKGLFRLGDQQWPNRTQSQVRSEIIDPFYYATSLDGFHGRNMERRFGAYKLQCVFVEKTSSNSDPTQYCFEPNSSILRYSRGFGWFQTVYNQIGVFQGRNLAKDIDVTNGGKPYLKLRVKTLELLSHEDESVFSPSPDAVGPLAGRVSGVSLMPINPLIAVAPQLPSSLSHQHFAVGVKFVIGKNGHVISAHAVSGPPEAYKWCEDSVRSWIFKPFFVLEKPVEVEQETSCTYN
jgi:hypothetical protein